MNQEVRKKQYNTKQIRMKELMKLKYVPVL